MDDPDFLSTRNVWQRWKKTIQRTKEIKPLWQKVGAMMEEVVRDYSVIIGRNLSYDEETDALSLVYPKLTSIRVLMQEFHSNLHH